MVKTMKDLEISGAILAEIYAQARAEFPNECCGYLRGEGDERTLVRCTNYQDRLHKLDPETYPRTAANGYNFGGRQQLDFANSFNGDDPARIIYHSHPRVGAYFSREDEAAALSAGWAVDYLVVDVQEHGVREAVLFRRDPQAGPEGPAFVAVARFPGEAP